MSPTSVKSSSVSKVSDDLEKIRLAELTLVEAEKEVEKATKAWQTAREIGFPKGLKGASKTEVENACVRAEFALINAQDVLKKLQRPRDEKPLLRPQLEKLINALLLEKSAGQPLGRANADDVAAAAAPAVALKTGLDATRVVRVLRGAIISAADAHGALDSKNMTSASKRATAQFRSDGLWKKKI